MDIMVQILHSEKHHGDSVKISFSPRCDVDD